jgi:hypothetical protein
MKKTVFSLLLILICSFFYACRKDFANERYTANISEPMKTDLGVMITTSVTGFVTDENNAPVNGALVTAGAVSTLTNQYGYFNITAASLPKIAGHVKVVYPGYFTGYKTFVCTDAKSTFTRIRLIPKSNIGTVNISTGGTATSPDGSSITLTAGSVVTASNSMAYTGNVRIAAHFIDPTDQQAMQLDMPGDLRGIDTADQIKGLTSYGMLAVELTGDAGQLLQITPGKYATLSFPIPPALVSAAPASIPLWSFNDSTGLWKEEGEAIKSGNNYVGNVGHFSYWNCDIPLTGSVPFQFQLVDSNLHPISNTFVLITTVTGEFTGYYGYTDSAGFANGYLPANTSLQIVNRILPCYYTAYSIPIVTGTSAVDLGTLIVHPAQAKQYTVTGSVVDCSGNPVNDGTIMLLPADGTGYVSAEFKNGLFRISTITCSNTTFTIAAIDNNTLHNSATSTITLSPTIENNIGTLQTCDSSSGGYFIYTLDNTTTIFSSELDTGRVSYYDTTIASVPGKQLVIEAYRGKSPIEGQNQLEVVTTPSTNGMYSLSAVLDEDITHPLSLWIYEALTIDANNPITITQQGVVGDYVSGYGSFPAIARYNDSSNHNISISFKLKRNR